MKGEQVAITRISTQSLIDKFDKGLRNKQTITITIGDDTFSIKKVESLAWGDNEGGYILDIEDKK